MEDFIELKLPSFLLIVDETAAFTLWNLHSYCLYAYLIKEIVITELIPSILIFFEAKLLVGLVLTTTLT